LEDEHARWLLERETLRNDPDTYLAYTEQDHSEGVVYLSPNSRFDHLLALPEGEAVGKALSDAMRDVEKNNPSLSGVLPKTYEIFNGTLLKELLKKVSEIPASLSYDAFGRIYEYFLGEFARTEGQKGGEFFTPSCIVRLLVEILEPFHGRILDPACGSGGMFVQSARFVAEHKRNGDSAEGTRSAATEISIYGQEKTGARTGPKKMFTTAPGVERMSAMLLRRNRCKRNPKYETIAVRNHRRLLLCTSVLIVPIGRSRWSSGW
jgi:type I restriction enzyme M protein